MGSRHLRVRAWITLAVAGALALLQPPLTRATRVELRRDVGGAQGPPLPPASPREADYIPADLEDCFVELERLLSPEALMEMRDAKEGDMVRYHHGLGTDLRNGWGLWRGSRLSAYFNNLGIQHPDDMSDIILTSFWRHLHGMPLDVKGQVARHEQYWERARTSRALEERRVERVKATLSRMMMGLTVADGVVPVVALPRRKNGGLRARHIVQFRRGALLTIRREADEGTTFRLEPYFLDLTRMALAPVRLAEIDTVSSTVVLDDAGYFLGRKKGRPTLVRIARGQRRVVTMPRVDSVPQLGLDRGHIMAVYARSIYHLDDFEWRPLYEGSVELPWSGPPPLKVDDRVYFRDEGRSEDDKRLWWLDLGLPSHLVSLEADCGLVGSQGPRWENVTSYAATPHGDLWIAVGNDHAGRSLLRRAPDGQYQIAIMNGEVAFDGDLLSTGGAIPISAVTMSGAEGLLVAGPTGLYRVHAGRIESVVSFANTTQDIPLDGGESVYHWGWEPTEILDLGRDRYIISGMFGGIYLLHRQPVGTFELLSLDSEIGPAIAL